MNSLNTLFETCPKCGFEIDQKIICEDCKRTFCDACGKDHVCGQQAISRKKNGFDPRPYQSEALNQIHYHWNQGTRRLLVVKATGLGKTVLFVVTIHDICNTTGKRALLLVHRDELVKQAAEKWEAYAKEKPEIEQSDQRAERIYELRGSDLVIASVQSISKPDRLHSFRPEDFCVVVVDEGHHCKAGNTYDRVIQYFLEGNPECRSLLVTATPERHDGSPLADFCDEVAFEMGILEGIDGGWLVPIKQKFVRIEELDFSVCRGGSRDFYENEIAGVMGGSALSAEDEELIKQQEEICHRIVHPILEAAQGRSVIVFAVNKEHAKRLTEVFNRRENLSGFLNPEWLGKAECLTEDTKDRDGVTKRYKSGETQILVSVNVPTEGFDAPNTFLIANAAPTKSKPRYAQRIGRGTRILPNVIEGIDDAGNFWRLQTAEERRQAIAESDKPYCLVLDFTGNCGEHKLVHTGDILGEETDPRDLALARQWAEESDEENDFRELANQARRFREDQEERERQAAEQQQQELARLRTINDEHARRRALVARVVYQTQDVDPFGVETVAAATPKKTFRGGASNKQIELLGKLGVAEQTAMSYSKKQAGAVIDELKKREGHRYRITFGKHSGKALGQLPVDYVAYLWDQVKHGAKERDRELRNQIEKMWRERDEHLNQRESGTPALKVY